MSSAIYKYLKNNIKKIIIISLIFLILSKKVSENFTTTQALDAVKATEKKVNDVYYSIEKEWIRSNKGIFSKRELKTDGNIFGRNLNATQGIKAATDVVGKNIKATDGIHGKKLCIDGVCIKKEHLQILNGTRHFFMANDAKDRFLWNGRVNGSYSKAEFKPHWADKDKRLFIYTSPGRGEPNH
jgi:hypothetical protein